MSQSLTNSQTLSFVISLPIFIFLLLAMGCAHKVAIEPPVASGAMAAERMNDSGDTKSKEKKVAIVIPRSIRNYSFEAQPSSTPCSAHTYKFNPGPTLAVSLEDAVGATYSNPEVIDSMPEKKAFEKILKFSFEGDNMDIYFVPQMFSSTAKADYSVDLTMAIHNGKTLDIESRYTFKGAGHVSEEASCFNANKIFGEAIEEGISDVSNNVSNILISQTS